MYASQEILEKEHKNPDEILEEIDKVSLSDVQRVAKEFLDTKLLSLAVIGNFESKDRFEELLK